MDESGDFWRSVTTEMAVRHNKCELAPPAAFQSVLAVAAAVMQRGTPQKEKSLTGKSGKAQPVPPTGIEPVRCFHRGILSPLRLPVPPPRQVYMNVIDCNMEAAPRIELGIKVLQTSALPLGYVALKGGAENEIRTRDPLLGKEVLYH